MAKKKHKVELIDVGDVNAEVVVLLRHYIERAKRGELSGLMLIAELPGGAYEAKMTSTSNAAERLGRLGFLYDDVLYMAEED